MIERRVILNLRSSIFALDLQSSPPDPLPSSAERQPLNGDRVLARLRVILDTVLRRVIAGLLVLRGQFNGNRYVLSCLQKSLGHHWFEEDHPSVVTPVDKRMCEGLAVKFV